MDKAHRIWESLHDEEYRDDWANEHINVGIAFQIRALREASELTQTQLAMRTGSSQPNVSDWEDPSYGAYTLSTLRKLRKAFGVGLLVRFVPYSELVDWTVNLTPERLAPPSFDNDRGLASQYVDYAQAFSPSVYGGAAAVATATGLGVANTLLMGGDQNWIMPNDFPPSGLTLTAQPGRVRLSRGSELSPIENTQYALAS